MRPLAVKRHRSLDGYNRFYFGNASRIYFGSGDAYEWRSSSDVGTMLLDTNGDLAIGHISPISIGFGYYTLQVGRCGNVYSRAYLSIGQDLNNSSVRQFRMVYKDSFNFTIGNWGGNKCNYPMDSTNKDKYIITI